MDLTNKVVWITGASSGIGKALVSELKNKGCKLIISSRREKELNQVKLDLKMNDEDCFVLPIDLEQHQNAHNWTEKALNKFDKIDILINNGGISQKSFALNTNSDIEQKIMNINYFGNVALSKAVIPSMQQRKTGKIVIITSILGKFGLPELSTYAASKHALYGFYESLRLELISDNIKILLAAPGFINTNAAINAVKGDGSIVNRNSDAQENGVNPKVAAKKIISAITTNKKHIYVGGKELLSIPFKTFLPSVFYNIMYKMGAKKK